MTFEDLMFIVIAVTVMFIIASLAGHAEAAKQELKEGNGECPPHRWIVVPDNELGIYKCTKCPRRYPQDARR